jgi:hypothetical protein
MAGKKYYEPGDILELGAQPYDFWAGPYGGGSITLNPFNINTYPDIFDQIGYNGELGTTGWVFGRWPNNTEVDRQVEALGYFDLSWTYAQSQLNSQGEYGPTALGSYRGYNLDTRPVWYRFVAGVIASTVPPDPPPPPDALPVLSSADATWGQVIPVSFGLRRITGVPIWLGSVSRIADHGFVGAVDFAIAFGTTARPDDDLRLIQLNRLWANGTLVYDALTVGAPIVQTGMSITFYPGSPDALPDPTISAAMGAGTPGFRNIIYVVIKGFPLKSGDTSVPRIRAELADAPSFIAPARTPFIPLDPPTALDGRHVIMDFDTGTLYGFSHVNSLPHALHSYDVASGTELSNTELDGSLLTGSVTDPVDQYSILFDDFAVIHDRFNNLAHIQSGSSLTNTIRLNTFRLDLARMIASYGNQEVFVTDSGPNTNTFMRNGELVRFRAFGQTIHGLILASLAFHEVVMLTYRTSPGPASQQNNAILDRTGILVPGTNFNLGYETKYVTNHAPPIVYSYPVLERPELIAQYQVDKRDRQDAVCLYGDDSLIYAFQGGLIGKTVLDPGGSLTLDPGATPANPPMSTEVSNIEWVTSIEPRALFDCGLEVPRVIFTDPATGCIMVIAMVSTSGDGTLYKLQPTWTLTNTGVALTALTQLYAVPITGIDQTALVQSIRASRLDSGSFSYMTSTQIRVISLATGSEIYRQAHGLGTSIDFAYDSVYDTLYAAQNGSIPPLPTKVNLRSGTSALVPVTDFLTWSGRKLGYPASDISFDPAITDTVIGGLIASPVTARMAMTTVATMYGVAVVEIGGKMSLARPEQGDNATLAAVFSKDDLSRLTENEHDSLATTAMAAIELPAKIEVGHLDPENDYNASTQVYHRPKFPFQTIKSQGSTRFEAPIVINASDALTIAGRLGLTAYGQGTAYQYRLPHRYVNLTPGDVIGFLGDDNVTITELSQIQQITDNGDWSRSMRGIRWSLSNTLIITADAPEGRQEQRMQGPSDSIAFAFDTPLLDPTDRVPGSAIVYTGVGSLGQAWWDSAQLSRSMDSATVPLYTTDIDIPWGQVTFALPPSESLGTTFKTDNDTVVEIIGKSLTSSMIKTITAEQCRAGYNAALVGQPGRWELIYFQTVTVLSAHRMQLTGILRGRRGTNVNCDNHHTSDQIIIVRSLNAKTNLIGDNLATSNRGKALNYYAVGTSTHRTPLPTTFTFEGASEKPWTVRRIRATLASEINAVGTTSYLNECGQGNRLDLIDVRGDYHFADALSADGGFAPHFANLDYSPYNLLDGVNASTPENATTLFSGQTNFMLVFDFHKSGFKQVIDEITLNMSSSTNIGTYSIEASDDGTSWTTLASGVDLSSGFGVHAFANTTAFWLYRIIQTGGVTSSVPFLREMKFKCKAEVANANDIVISWLRRDRLKPAAHFLTDDLQNSDPAGFDVEILTATNSPLRTLPLVAGPRALYSAADQTTDGFTPPLLNLTVRISQLGAGTADNRLGFSQAKTVEVT